MSALSVAIDQQYVVVAAVTAVPVDPQSLSFADAVHLSSRAAQLHGGALACDGHRCTRRSSNRPLPCRSQQGGITGVVGVADTEWRWRGALCDRALARDDSVLAM
jgi:hypothetical protein